MLNPPFKRSFDFNAAAATPQPPCCGQDHHHATEPAQQARARLAQLDPHLHCSVIGTCLALPELRKLMSRYIVVAGLSELDVHHEAVRMAAQNGEAAKQLHKALDQRHAGALRRFAAATNEEELGAAWDESRAQGDIPGAYWAVLTHRQCTPALRQRAFGEVHMLSHLVGAANQADLRRLVALERENAELGERLEREQQRRHELVQQREDLGAKLREQGVERVAAEAAQAIPLQAPPEALVALHTQRREQAEQQAAQARAAAEQARQELEQLRRHAQALAHELAAAERHLRLLLDDAAGPLKDHAPAPLAGRRLLYVGGRPSAIPALRDLVQRLGGEFLHHDGGLETRKGLLAALVQKADQVLFPVDCIDHDSALNLKRLAERQGIPTLPLRSAGVASLAAALAPPASSTDGSPARCLRHA
ncbi:DUF2325 domain-containing protein [Pelomonas sp. KK5]|uniref:DUF2325 domain-containing protein n=1 Tax=Pelomonas sp. KK5 TaxID=1855730 RepID=UPI00097C1C56|nr:DUF2325 domain-containing protein [Pelomonas sp. KK5]